jgi:hypothetical protein
VDVIMAGGADHEGLAPSIRHDLGPPGLARAGRVEIRELADLMNLDIARGAAKLAGVRQQAGDQFLVWIVNRNRLAVDELGRALPLEWDTTEPCDQWLPGNPLNP